MVATARDGKIARVAKVLQFASKAPVVPVESRYGLRAYQPAVTASEAVVGDMVQGVGIVLEIDRARYRCHDKLTFRCRCGKISDPTLRCHLASGHTRSCGHLRSTWAESLYAEMGVEERTELFITAVTEGKRKTAKRHGVPLFVVDHCRRRHLEDLMADDELVTLVRRTVSSAARFNDGLRRAARYSELSMVEVRAIWERAKKSERTGLFPAKFELSAEGRALLERALKGLHYAEDPLFHELTVSEAADELLATVKEASDRVADTLTDSLHLTTAEFASPGTQQFSRSHGLLGWAYCVLNVLTSDELDLLGYEARWLLGVFRRNIAARDRRRRDAIEAKQLGIAVERSGRGRMNRFEWMAPGIDANAAADVLVAGNSLEILMTAAA